MSDSVRTRRAAATARKRRYRRLQKAGGAFLRVPVSDIDAVIETLLALRWLAEALSENRNEIGAAAGRLLDDLAAWKKKTCPAWTDELRIPWQDRSYETDSR